MADVPRALVLPVRDGRLRLVSGKSLVSAVAAVEGCEDAYFIAFGDEPVPTLDPVGACVRWCLGNRGQYWPIGTSNLPDMVADMVVPVAVTIHWVSLGRQVTAFAQQPGVRTEMAAACLLVGAGFGPAEAIKTISSMLVTDRFADISWEVGVSVFRDRLANYQAYWAENAAKRERRPE